MCIDVCYFLEYVLPHVCYIFNVFAIIMGVLQKDPCRQASINKHNLMPVSRQ